MTATSGQSAALQSALEEEISGLLLSDEAPGNGPLMAYPSGEWIIASISKPNEEVAKLEAMAQNGRKVIIDLSNLKSLDTSGAWLLARLRENWAKAGGGSTDHQRI